jgi:hypothetical protein
MPASAPAALLIDTDPAVIRRVMEVNFFGAANLTAPRWMPCRAARLHRRHLQRGRLFAPLTRAHRLCRQQACAARLLRQPAQRSRRQRCRRHPGLPVLYPHRHRQRGHRWQRRAGRAVRASPRGRINTRADRAAHPRCGSERERAVVARCHLAQGVVAEPAGAGTLRPGHEAPGGRGIPRTELIPATSGSQAISPPDRSNRKSRDPAGSG